MSGDQAADPEPADDETHASETDETTEPGTAESSADPSTNADELTDSVDSLVDRVAEHDEGLAEEVAKLGSEVVDHREEVSTLDAEVDELTSKLARVRADFKNYKQRAKRKQAEIRERASEDLVARITPVRNDLLRALDQTDGSDLRPGVESTLEKFDDVLADEGVEAIEPDPGDEVDPKRHQVMLRVDSDSPAGTVHELYEPGYEMGERVIEEAQITVSKDENE